MALTALRKLQTPVKSSHEYAQPSNGATRLIFGQIFRLLLYFMYANSEGSGDTAPEPSLSPMR